MFSRFEYILWKFHLYKTFFALIAFCISELDFLKILSTVLISALFLLSKHPGFAAAAPQALISDS